MDIYFDLIPKELIEMILFNIETIEDYENLRLITPFGEVLLTQRYWIEKIKLTCPSIDLKSVPQSLLNFGNPLFDITLMNYGSILRAYNYMVHILNFHDKYVRDKKRMELSGETDEDISTWAFDLNVNNFDLLRLDLLSREDLLEIRHLFIVTDFAYPSDYQDRKDQNGIAISFYDTDKYKFTITGKTRHINYFVSRQDAINILIHLQCNEANEVEPF